MLKGRGHIPDSTWPLVVNTRAVKTLGEECSLADFLLVIHCAQGEWVWGGAWPQVLGDQGSNPRSVTHQSLTLTNYMVIILKINFTKML